MGITAVEQSKNSKTGLVSATYASTKTCPKTCPFKGTGCYGELGHTAILLQRLNAVKATPQTLAKKEATAIRGLSGRLPLRVHVTGDCASNTAAKTVAKACNEYSQRHGQPTWTYTHAWRTVDASSWGSVSVLASCETADDVRAAWAKGYAVCVTGSGLEVDGMRMVQCPAENRPNTTCSNCKLCWNAPRLRANGIAIVFTPHGARKRKVQSTIEQLRQKGGQA